MGAEHFREPTRIRGGDTFIDIDGVVGHHPKHLKKSLEFLKNNYDAIFFAFLVPHPNKLYGFDPVFLPFFTQTDLPKAATISDGYWSTYKEWGRQAVPYCKKLYAGCKAYAVPLQSEGIDIEVQSRPFFPQAPQTVRDKEMLTVWCHQWKDIKGIIPFLKAVPTIPGNIEMYSCGIRYYQIRETDTWKKAINIDHFKNFNGEGKADYFGWVPFEATPDIYRRAWFSVGLQGITAKASKTTLFGTPASDPKTIYGAGSYNNSETEALYYGAVPVLHNQVLKSDLPKECILTVSKADELPKLLGSKAAKSFVADPNRVILARQWVLDNHSAGKIYRILKKDLGI